MKYPIRTIQTILTAFYQDRWKDKINLESYPHIINTKYLTIFYNGIKTFKEFKAFSFTIKRYMKEIRDLLIEVPLEERSHKQLMNYLREEYVSDPEPCPLATKRKRKVK